MNTRQALGQRLRFHAVLLLAPAVLSFLPLLGSASSTSPGHWAPFAALPVPTGEVIGAVWQGQIVVVGGLGPGWATSDKVWAYEPGLQRWKPLPNLPVPLNHHAVVSVAGSLYVMGGATSFGPAMREQPRTFALAPDGRAWVEKRPMPEPRWGHAAAALDGRIYVAGGLSAGAGHLLIYDPAGDKWEFGPPLPTPRDHLAVVVYQGRLYALGGRIGNRNTGVLEVYDPASESWSKAPSMPTPRSGLAAAIVGHRLHTAGGEDPWAGRVYNTHEWYDLDAGSWQAAPRLPRARHGVLGIAWDGRFIVAGGSSHAGSRSHLGWLDDVAVFVDP